MKRLLVIALAGAALGGCHKTAPIAPPPQAPQANAGAIGVGPGANANDLTVEQLQAKAQAAEAEAQRLEAQAGAAGQTTGGGGDGAMSLSTTDEKLNTGQYYKAATFQAQAGETYRVVYDVQGYQPAMVILGPDNQKDSESVGPAPDQSGTAHLEADTKIDRTGTWHALLTSVQPGATGSFRAQVMKVTETPLN